MSYRVLVVTDVEEIARRIGLSLEDEEIEVDWSPSARLALQALAESPRDLVVADSQIGSMGGFALCADIKLETAAGRLPEIPVLVMLDRRADSWLARQLGADGFLVKPINPLRLRRAVRSLLSGKPYEDPVFVPFTHPRARLFSA